MSETYNLCCRTCEEHIWIGQGHASTLYFYSGSPETVAAFNIFLRRHLSEHADGSDWPKDWGEPHHELVFLESQHVPEDWTEVHNVYEDDTVPDYGKWITYDMSQPLGA